MDVIKLMISRRDHPGFKVGPKPNAKCPRRRKAKGGLREDTKHRRWREEGGTDWSSSSSNCKEGQCGLSEAWMHVRARRAVRHVVGVQ